MSDVQNLERTEALEKLRALVKNTNTAMLCTNLSHAPFSTCPMSTQEVDDEGNIWFFSARDSQHNIEIKADSQVQLLYANPGSSSFLNIFGKAEILYDPAKVEELWSSLAKVWFQEGKDDPNLSLIKVSPQEAFYWDTKHGKMVSFLKMIASIATGKTMDDGVQGQISV